MSLRPQYANAILQGTKLYEIRRTRPQFVPGTVVWLYATKPIGAIVGSFEVGVVISGEPSKLWHRFGQSFGVESGAFQKYVRGREQVFAIQVLNVRPAVFPLPPGLTPPQSYRYLKVDSLGLPGCDIQGPPLSSTCSKGHTMEALGSS